MNEDQELQRLNRILAQRQNEREKLEAEEKSINDKLERITFDESVFARQLATQRENEKQLITTLKLAQEKLQLFQDERRKKNQRLNVLQNEYNKIEKQVANAKINMRESAKTKRMTDIVESLKRLFQVSTVVSLTYANQQGANIGWQ